MMLRNTLNGQGPRTLQDAARDPHDWWQHGEPDLLHPRMPRGRPSIASEVAICLGYLLFIFVMLLGVHYVPAAYEWAASVVGGGQ